MLFDFDEEMEEFDADATQSEDEEFENAKDEEIDLDIDMRDDQDEIECLAFIEFEPIDEDEDYTPSRQYPLYPGKEITVGREIEKCTYVIQDDRISKEHFRIYSIIYSNDESEDAERLPPLIYCQDLESCNGTYVNGRLIGKITQEKIGYLLSDGDVIEIRPSWRFRFHQTIAEPARHTRDQQADMKFFCDRFEVSTRVLGSGNYGKVYLAAEAESTKQVACKIVDLRSAMEQLQDSASLVDQVSRFENGKTVDLDEKKRVLREIRILAKLSHPHIINIRKAYLSQNSLYLFMELSTGGDLFSYVQSQGEKLGDYNARFIARQITSAVQFLHANDIAHRDIKAENVLVSHTHFGGRVVLTDFGFAIQLNTGNMSVGNGTGTHRMHSKIGTEGYVAPEITSVTSEDRSYTVAVDLWSLGVLTVFLFTGDSEIPYRQMRRMNPDRLEIAGKDSDRANRRWDIIPAKALEFICKLLQISPKARMTAEEALEHSWFTKPAGEATALMESIEKINKFWLKRDSEEEILEGIRGVVIPSLVVPMKPAAKWRKKLPDVSSSPYFSLDRHLSPRQPSGRQRILEDLNGSPFIRSQAPSVHNISEMAGRRTSIQPVQGSDIFGQSMVESDELDLLPVPQDSEKEYGYSFSDGIEPTLEAGAVDTPCPPSAKKRKSKSNIAEAREPRYLPGQDFRERLKNMTIHGGIGSKGGKMLPLQSRQGGI